MIAVIVVFPLLQHVHFDGVVEIDSIIDACRILKADNGEWKVRTSTLSR